MDYLKQCTEKYPLLVRIATFVGIVFVVFFSFLFIFSRFIKEITPSKPQKILVATPIPTPTLAPLQFIGWKNYENKLAKFTLDIPSTWTIQEQKDRNTSILKRTSTNIKTSSIQETTITFVKITDSDQPLTSTQEFNELLKKDPEKEDKENQRVYKLDNINVDGSKAVVLLDIGRLGEQDDQDWSIVTWTQKNGMNYYINTKGNKQMTQHDFETYYHLLSTFKFK